ncbi:PH domain-containing protein [Erythrobacter dokdonensis]|uniref:Membrane-flanked domain-containing protein n=1 Tax=Erythrobacter dokdonensis DSW-74 TaxID=1300349 RepID=A0A1A7BDK2_9SPHN|nr:PH domain-containing protein [Erythrobacter dokdonensis]OBV10613.1 membrane-flanked domain-containing protein [Erythrobacter dokdonensis DSW-74]
MSEARHTAPLSVAVGAIGAIRSAIFPAVAIIFSGIGGSGRFLIGIGVGVASIVIGTLVSYIGWRRLTYTIGAQDIRVESGILSRSARSVPYERIQDVSLEAKLLPRLLGLAAVKFETGAGGGEDLSLQYLTAAEGERLRRLVRARRDEERAADSVSDEPGSAPEDADEGEVLFRLGPRRLLTFGLFEFSLAVFAVLGGILQYVDSLTNFEVWDFDLWRDLVETQGVDLVALDARLKVLGAVTGLFGLVLIGFGTGIVRTFARDWGFTLTRGPRGFRRLRGLFTRTDVVMPAHRVQALVIGTGLLRYRFGWHSLSFVSLAQDAGSASHVVAPFARMDEVAAIATSAGFHLPDARTHWQRASRRYLADRIIRDSAILLLAAIPAAIFAPPGVVLIPIGLAVLAAGVNLYSWEFRRHAVDDSQIFSSHGLLSPTSQTATRLKLHSVEIAQGPLARWRGYATVHLGLAGGEFAIRGVPLAEARALRAKVLATIAATDFSRLDQSAGQTLSDAQSGFSANFAAT